MLRYPAVLTSNDGFFTVTFPDIPEAITQGKDVAEARQKAQEALVLALEDYEDFPKPSTIEALESDYPESILTMITFEA